MAKPAYAGPKPLAEALSELRLARGEDAKFHREGLRVGSECRDLGLAAKAGQDDAFARARTRASSSGRTC